GSIGHSDGSSEVAEERFDAGARGVTHLFNAMSHLGHRAPGLVGGDGGEKIDAGMTLERFGNPNPLRPGKGVALGAAIGKLP
ncbi:hypothetical protein ACC808_37275, partial [Rhizobium ruizarguesonis]